MPGCALAHKLTLTLGAGSQPHADHYNKSAGVDFSFLRFERSPRQHLQVGISYTWIETDTSENRELWALSIYPQLTLYPRAEGGFRGLFPRWAEPYFFVRALGPSYLSSNQLGERQQSNHFAFQAQVGLGLILDVGGRPAMAALSYKHFSNAGLFSDNDGIDVPLVLSLGMRF